MSVETPIDIQVAALRIYLYAALRSHSYLQSIFADSAAPAAVKASAVCKSHHASAQLKLKQRGERPVVERGAVPSLSVFDDDNGSLVGVTGHGMTLGYRRTIYAQYAQLIPGKASDAEPEERARAISMAAMTCLKEAVEDSAAQITWEGGSLLWSQFFEDAKPTGWARLVDENSGIFAVELAIECDHASYVSYPEDDPAVELVELLIAATTELPSGEELTVNERFDPTP